MKKTSVVLFVFFACFGLTVLLSAQAEDDYPCDTSFSQRSAFQKIKKDYPNAVPVEEFIELHINSRRDIIYTSYNDRALHLDIFWPGDSKETNVPVVICIHGGGWASGNKSHLLPLAQKLASEGFVAATIEYRLSPEAQYPSAVLDSKTAIRWMKENAKEYGVDTAKIVVLGTSAGATVASLIGTTAGNPSYLPIQNGSPYSDEVQAIINIDGVLDFTDPAESGKDGDPAKPSAAARWFGSTYAENPAIWKEASPLMHVNKHTPPTLFINSAIPRFHAGRDAYIEVLEKNKIYSGVHTIRDTPHPFWMFYPWFDETIETILEFLSVVWEN